MAFDAYLYVDGVPGESTDDAHPEWMNVESYDHAVSMAVSEPDSSGGLTGGDADISHLSVTKVIDNASVDLNLKCVKGEHIPEVKLELCQSTGDKHCFMRYTLTNVLVSSVTAAGPSGDPKPSEILAFAFGKLKWEYTPINADGTVGDTIDRTWNLETNVQE